MAGMLLLLIVLTSTFQFLDSAVVISGATPTPPLSSDATKLPSTNLALQYVALGRGTQNYACTSLSSPPVQRGAVSILFNATWLAYYAEPVLNAMPPIAVYMPPPFDVLGRHFFDSTGTPTFGLYSMNKILYEVKTSDIKAPATANKGPAGTGVVDWLQVTAKPGYESKGISPAYRVVTAGGQPSNCTAIGPMTVQYVAEYWFYD